MDLNEQRLRETIDACRTLIEERFPGGESDGAAAMLLDNGTIVTGTAPEAVNPAVQVCHETEPYLAAFRLGREIVASVCLHREQGSILVLSPCGVCRERLATHGPEVLVAVPAPGDPGQVSWRPLSALLPSYWPTVFDDVPSDGWVS
jgi:cytidine deaminase